MLGAGFSGSRQLRYGGYMNIRNTLIYTCIYMHIVTHLPINEGEATGNQADASS